MECNKVNNMQSSEKRIDHDRQHLLNIFPQEVWLLIFDQIGEPNDREHFSNSSQFFRDLVLSQRTHFLFKSVWGILVWKQIITIPKSAHRANEFRNYCKKHLHCEYFEDSDEEDDLDEEEFDEAYTLHYNIVHGLRAVCKSWNEVVTNFYENLYISTWKILHSLPRQHQHILKIIENNCSFINNSSVYENKDLAFFYHFKETHETTNQNPFFGRFISLNLSTHNVVEWKRTLSIFTTYGNHIWYFKLVFSNIYNRPQELSSYYITIRKFLQLMPSLKMLSIKFIDFSLGSLEHLQSEIRAHPLPTLKDLQVVQFDPYAETVVIFQELIRRNPHISTLDIFSEDDQEAISTVPLPQLKVLYINLGTERKFLNFMSPSVKFSLAKLCFNVNDGFELIDWQRIFTALQNKWADSLTELVINMPTAGELNHQWRIFQESHTLQLCLPHLKYFSMSMPTFCCLDFLLSLTSLEHLSIRIVVEHVQKYEFVDVDKLEETSRIKFLSCASRPLESNIWSLLPKLQRIEYFQRERKRNTKLNCHIARKEWAHNREEWERENNKANQIVHLEK